MKKIIPLLAIAVLALTGCSSIQKNTELDEEYGYRVFTAELPDGTTTQCVWLKHGNAGGLSCQ